MHRCRCWTKMISEVLGVMKAYTTRVGAGPFVTELLDETGDKIRDLGHEYGTTTGRPPVRMAGCIYVEIRSKINGLTGLCMNHLDTIGKLDTIKLCVGYRLDGN